MSEMFVFFLLTTVKLLTQERTSPLIFSNLLEGQDWHTNRHPSYKFGCFAAKNSGTGIEKRNVTLLPIPITILVLHIQALGQHYQKDNNKSSLGYVVATN